MNVLYLCCTSLQFISDICTSDEEVGEITLHFSTNLNIIVQNEFKY